MKKLVFNKKYFVRAKEKDFRDDGNTFRFYYYKGIVPISVLHTNENYYGSEGSVFCDIRLDYAGIPYEQRKKDYDIIDMFNGVSDDNFDMDKLIENCEYCMKKYF